MRTQLRRIAVVAWAVSFACIMLGVLAPQASADKPDTAGVKVFVCKYVGTPGVNEVLQTGQNPIDVSVNAIPAYAGVGSWFADAQGRSFVLGPEHAASDHVDEPSVSQCPTTEVTTTTAPVTTTVPEVTTTVPEVTTTIPEVTTTTTFHDNRCDDQHPDEGNDDQGHNNPDCDEPTTTTTVAETTTTLPEVTTTVPEVTTTVPEVTPTTAPSTTSTAPPKVTQTTVAPPSGQVPTITGDSDLPFTGGSTWLLLAIAIISLGAGAIAWAADKLTRKATK